MKYKRILIAGAGGSIGSELTRQLSVNNQVFIFDQNETACFDLAEELKQKGRQVSFRIGDIREWETVKEIFNEFKPEIVINAAALKHVTPSQYFPREYVMTNVIGHLNLIKAVEAYGTEKMLYISTDKAVSGKKNVMGATKMCAETINSAMGYISVRFGNVLNSRGSVLEIWDRQFKAGEPITITDLNMERYMMEIPEACSLVIEAIEKGNGGEVFILDMGKPKKIIDLKNERYGESYPIEVIGVRPGESMSEQLMTLDEEKRAIKDGRFFIIK